MIITEKKEVSLMKKLFTIITLMVAIMVSNIADAKFSDEYRAKYPKRVKVTTQLNANGKTIKKVEYKLFNRRIGTGHLQLSVNVSDDIVKLCTITFWRFDTYPKEYNKICWGDGKEAHDWETQIISYDDFGKHVGYQNVLIAHTFNFECLEKAVVFSAHHFYQDDIIIDKSHKYWDEWIEALKAASKIMSERYSKEQ